MFVCTAARNSSAELAATVTVDGRFKTVVEADIHRVDVNSCRTSRRVQSTSNSLSPSSLKTPAHRWTPSAPSRCSPRRPRLSDGDCGVHIGRTSSNVETRSSAKAEAEIGALESRRVHSCEYDARSTSMLVCGDRARQQPQRLRAPRSAPRTKPSVLLVPPAPVERRTSDKVPRYNDTGSFEEVDEQMLMMAEKFDVHRRGSSATLAAAPAQQPEVAVTARTSSCGGMPPSPLLQDIVGAQCRKLWDLRATLEQSDNFSDDGPLESSRQSGGISDEVAGPRDLLTNRAPSLLPLPSDVRRQTYQHLAVERRTRQPGTATPGGLPGTSVDSVEAPETDGDASDTSRYDFTTTSLESSTTTTTTTDNNTDTPDGRGSSARSPRLSAATLSAAPSRLDAASREDEGHEVLSDADVASRLPATPPSSSSSAQPSCSDENRPTSRVVELDETASEAHGIGGGVSLRTAARKRRDFRSERMSMNKLAIDHDDRQSSTDQPSGDSVDGGSGRTSSGRTAPTATSAIDAGHASRCGPSNALRRFLSYQLSSQSSRSLRCRHAGLRDYRLVMRLTTLAQK